MTQISMWFSETPPESGFKLITCSNPWADIADRDMPPATGLGHSRPLPPREQLPDVVQHGAIVQPFRRRRPLFAKVTCERQHLADRCAQHCPHTRVIAPDPRGKRKPGPGGIADVDQGNIDVMFAAFEAFTRLVAASRFHDAVAALTKILRQRMAHEHVLLDEQYSCCLHACYSAGPSISAIIIAICFGS